MFICITEDRKYDAEGPKQCVDDYDLTRNDEVFEQSIASEQTVLLNLAAY